jgi:CheY-like chemotaxis protein
MDNIQVLGGILKSEGLDVEFAIDGRSALDWVEKQKFDIILLDINMPGMDGYEATRQIRQSNKEVIIIVQTAYANSSEKEKAIEAGCNDYISKPINKTLLKELIKKHCNK